MERFHIFLVLHNSCKFSIFCYNIFLEPSLNQAGTRKDLPYTLTYLIIEEFCLLSCISDFALPPRKHSLLYLIFNCKNYRILQILFTFAPYPRLHIPSSTFIDFTTFAAYPRLFHPPRLLDTYILPGLVQTIMSNLRFEEILFTMYYRYFPSMQPPSQFSLYPAYNQDNIQPLNGQEQH